ncbi:lipocalin-like domain-containing protein [Aquimarina sp. AD1]|uniref:lipocalin-like domain-containing protein n=1 Tax=Aquimarina sp. (strain AD1) TaxID=1714848 RepID=UPI000EA850E9|nr:glycoside hydrolase family 43 C-terminal domain-containing protein [Aquimarina sp. AD1]
MRQTIFLVLSLLIFQIGISQNLTESDLVGEWDFIELQDENGEKQTKIPLIRFGRDMGIENVNRDSYVLNDDGTYKSFNPLNTSYGTWFFDKKTNAINLELRIEPDSPYLPSLKKAKIVKKRKDGFYYQKPVQKKILIFSKDGMIIADREKYVLIYKRK